MNKMTLEFSVEFVELNFESVVARASFSPFSKWASLFTQADVLKPDYFKPTWDFSIALPCDNPYYSYSNKLFLVINMPKRYIHFFSIYCRKIDLM